MERLIRRPLARTASALAEYLTVHPEELDQATLLAFRERSEELRKPIEIEAFETLAVQRLAAPLAEQIMACLPGAGNLDRRMLHVIRRANGHPSPPAPKA